jgi:RNA polymerase sigma factor (sigma-70 family)
VDPATGPSDACRRQELRRRVRQAVAALDEDDREALALRYLEHLPAGEVAAVLGLTEAAAKKQALRALRRLRGLLEGDAPGGGP